MTTGIKSWSTTPGDNNSPSPNGAPEGMAPSQVNDVIRQNMSEVREWYEDASWIDLGLAGLTYVDADTFRLTGDQTDQFHVGRRVRAIGTTPFTIYGTITASTFSTNTTIDVTWDSGSLDATLSEVALGPEADNKIMTYEALKLPSTGIPDDDLEYQQIVGAITMYGGSSAPSNWLLCDGSAVSRTTYSALFAIIGTTFGTGDGSTTFNLPDFSGRSPLGVGQGTTGEGDVTGTDRSLADTGGYETHTLTEAEMPSHTHDAATGAVGTGNFAQGTGAAIDRTTKSTGGDDPHNNMHPFLAVNFIIFAGV